MNVKALLFAAVGFLVFAAITTMWAMGDMNEAREKRDAKTKRECADERQSITASGISNATAELVERCEAVGIELPSMEQPQEAAAAATAAITEQSQPATVSPTETFKPRSNDRPGDAFASVLEASRQAPKSVAARNAAIRARLEDRVISIADSVPVGQTGIPSQRIDRESGRLPQEDTTLPDSIRDGSVTSVIS